jgi:hypothetical protein
MVPAAWWWWWQLQTIDRYLRPSRSRPSPCCTNKIGRPWTAGTKCQGRLRRRSRRVGRLGGVEGRGSLQQQQSPSKSCCPQGETQFLHAAPTRLADPGRRAQSAKAGLGAGHGASAAWGAWKGEGSLQQQQSPSKSCCPQPRRNCSPGPAISSRCCLPFSNSSPLRSICIKISSHYANLHRIKLHLYYYSLIPASRIQDFQSLKKFPPYRFT